MSSDDQETATVHDANRENMTVRTASSRSEVLILPLLCVVCGSLDGIFKTQN